MQSHARIYTRADSGLIHIQASMHTHADIASRKTTDAEGDHPVALVAPVPPVARLGRPPGPQLLPAVAARVAKLVAVAIMIERIEVLVATERSVNVCVCARVRVGGV